MLGGLGCRVALSDLPELRAGLRMAGAGAQVTAWRTHAAADCKYQRFRTDWQPE
jgi:hypothetical protein